MLRLLAGRKRPSPKGTPVLRTTLGRFTEIKGSQRWLFGGTSVQFPWGTVIPCWRLVFAVCLGSERNKTMWPRSVAWSRSMLGTLRPHASEPKKMPCTGWRSFSFWGREAPESLLRVFGKCWRPQILMMTTSKQMRFSMSLEKVSTFRRSKLLAADTSQQNAASRPTQPSGQRKRWVIPPMLPLFNCTLTVRRVATRTASIVGSMLIAGCAVARMFIGPSVVPEAVAVPIEKGGQLQQIDLTLRTCEVIQPTIYFPRRELRDESLLRLVGALPGAAWKQTPGVSLRLKVTFNRQIDGGEPHTSVLWRSMDVTTDIVESWGNEDVGRIFGATTLPAGRYLVVATLVEGEPQLSGLHPTFGLWSSFKLSPSAEKCNEPPSH